MKVLGITLRKPTADELTGAAVMAVGLWVLAVAIARQVVAGFGAADAGAMLVVIAWGCISVRLGIRIDQGQRHVAANVFVSAMLLALYQGAWAFAS